MNAATGSPRITLPKSTLRPWEDADEASLIESANNRKIWIHQLDGFPHPFTQSDARRWLNTIRDVRPADHLAIDVGGRGVGGVGIRFEADVYRRSAEIGYWIGEPYWGRGIMTEAVRAMIDYSFSTFDLCRIFARIFAWNPASVRVAQKAGFRFEGRLKKAVTKANRTTDIFLFAVVR
jgi:RimJ/RimL family protein N-acetyltransferase